MNYVVLCDNAKMAHNMFYEAVTYLYPISVNMKTKKVIYEGDVYSFESREFFEKYLKSSFRGETMEYDYFYCLSTEPFR